MQNLLLIILHSISQFYLKILIFVLKFMWMQAVYFIINFKLALKVFKMIGKFKVIKFAVITRHWKDIHTKMHTFANFKLFWIFHFTKSRTSIPVYVLIKNHFQSVSFSFTHLFILNWPGAFVANQVQTVGNFNDKAIEKHTYRLCYAPYRSHLIWSRQNDAKWI